MQVHMSSSTDCINSSTLCGASRKWTSGDVAHTIIVLQVDSIQSDALFILLVEKDAAFMRLAEDRFYNSYPCIILTAKGQPDVASRCSQ